MPNERNEPGEKEKKLVNLGKSDTPNVRQLDTPNVSVAEVLPVPDKLSVERTFITQRLPHGHGVGCIHNKHR
jgi:hypothetical protein